ncbi:MAG: ATP-binding cassette domain-containing protein, partial [Aquabacterium sp.]
LVGQWPATGTTRAQLAQAMVGHEVAAPRRQAGGAAGAAAASATPVAELREATVRGGDGARPALDRVSLQMHAREIVAVAGVSGNGQRALAELLHGLVGADAGTVLLHGQPMPARPRAWLAAGVARIPEDRLGTGIVGDMALWENAALEHYHAAPLSHHGWLDRAAARRHAQRLVDDGDIRGTEAAGLDTVTRGLSGGNVQKLILGRALAPPAAGPVRLIVAAQPTWGLDVGAVAAVHQRLLDACDAGAAVLLISDDLDEIMALADRVAVIHHGRLTPARPTSHWTLQAIGLAMAGAGPATAAPLSHAA